MADSGGMRIVTDIDTTNWTIGNFFQQHGLQPSRHKIYFMLDLEVSYSVGVMPHLFMSSAHIEGNGFNCQSK